MKNLFLMLSFFTRLPVPFVEYTEERYRRGLKWVPAIGLLLGGLLYGVSFLHLILDPDLVALVLIACYVAASGALHLDGLADSFDGLLSGRDKDRVLEIMKDSHIGSFGTIALIFYFLSFFILLGKVPYEALLLMPLVGKSAPILSAYFSPYARPEGMGKVFTEHCGKAELSIALLLPIAVAVALDPWYLAAVAVALAVVLLLTQWSKRVIGGITGDTMGMVCELSQLTFLFAVNLLGNLR